MTFLCITIFHRHVPQNHPWTLLYQRPQTAFATSCQANLRLCGCLVGWFVLCLRNISDHCSLQICQSSLCSNLCSVPVVAMAVNPPDPVEQWIFSACATWPKPQDTPDIQATLLYAGLTLAGVIQLRDFEGLNSAEAMTIWPHLKETPTGFVDHLFSCLPRAMLAQARRCDETLPNAIRQVQRRVEESDCHNNRFLWESLNSRMTAAERHQEPSLHQDWKL